MDDSSDVIRFIVEELGKSPFTYDFNVASFASLPNPVLLRVCHTVLCEIDPKYKEEAEEELTSSQDPVNISKILDVLRILRYWPKNNVPDDIRDALELPIPETVWEIIAWLLLKKDELKQRAYLAQFLVRIHIPDEIMADEEVAQCFDEYEDKMGLFKETHKNLLDIKRQMEKRPVNELVSDLGRIDHDVDCLRRKVDSLKNRIGDVPQKVQLLEQAKHIRKSREAKLLQLKQLEQEENKMYNVNKRIELMHLQLSDLAMATEGGTPEAIMTRAEQDADIYKEIVGEKLPQQIHRAKRAYLALKITEENPPLCRSDLELRRARIEEVCNEIAAYEKTIQPKYQDATVNFAREQTQLNQRKKLDLNVEVQSMNKDLKTLQDILDAKRYERSRLHGDDPRAPSTVEGYSNYVKHMRVKASQYKAMRAELHGLQAEIGNLSVTKYILEGELKTSESRLQDIENELGIVGFTSMQERFENISGEKSSADFKKLEGINEMADLAKKLYEQLNIKKHDIKPLMTDVSLARKQSSQLVGEREEAKRVMDLELGSLHKQINCLEKENNEIDTKYNKEMLQYIKLSAEIPIMKTNMKIANNPPSGQPHFLRNNMYDRFRSAVIEAERNQSDLKNEIDQIDDVQEYEENQRKAWSDITKLLQAKVSHMKLAKDNSNPNTVPNSANTFF